VAIVFAVGLVACGDDDSSSDETQTDETTPETTSGSDTTVPSDSTVPSDTTGDTAESSTRPSGADDLAAFCDPMEELANFDGRTAETGALVRVVPFEYSFLGFLEELQEQLLIVREEAEDLYAAAIEIAPAEIEDDLQRPAAYMDEAFDLITNAKSNEEIFEFVNDRPEDVTEATANLNAFVKEICGFELPSGR
jgi:hypothetical protein